MPPVASSRGEALAITPRRLPAGLPLAMALALTDAPSEVEGPAALAGGGSVEGARRLLLLAPGPELVVLDVPGDEARLRACRRTTETQGMYHLCLATCTARGIFRVQASQGKASAC